MFAKVLEKTFPQVQILGFVDKFKTGENIKRLQEIKNLPFDHMLIVSANHFESIYGEHRKAITLRKILKVIVKENLYFFQSQKEISKEKIYSIPHKFRMILLRILSNSISILGLKRSTISFVAKSFIGNNLKALHVYSAKKSSSTTLLTDDLSKLEELRKNGFLALKLNSFRAVWKLAFSKIVIQDQGNFTEPLTKLSPRQKSIQMWHGIPLKRMNRLANYTYDFLISPSDYVNETSLADVIVARKHLDFGYPRNDLLLKKHEEHDLLLCDRKLYELAKQRFRTDKKILVYMPTHRESATSIAGYSKQDLIPLDLESLDHSLDSLSCTLILKLHPFVKQFQEKHIPEKGFRNIYFHSTDGDIYPLLKYTDILITDYSSIFFDFLLLNRPIIFFDYDFKQYSSNMGGFVYDYEKMTPGPKVKNQGQLIEEIGKQLSNEDEFHQTRFSLCQKLFTHQDANSSQRIFDNLISDIDRN